MPQRGKAAQDEIFPAGTRDADSGGGGGGLCPGPLVEQPGRGGEIQLTDAIRVLAGQQAVYAYNFFGRRYDIGDKEGFLEATVEQALKRPELRDRFLQYLVKTVGPLLDERK